MPKIALFIPCYVDQLYPKVGLATWRILRSLDLDVEFPEQQTCCGQPMGESAGAAPTAKLAERFLEVFGGDDQIVVPPAAALPWSNITMNSGFTVSRASNTWLRTPTNSANIWSTFCISLRSKAISPAKSAFI